MTGLNILEGVGHSKGRANWRDVYRWQHIVSRQLGHMKWSGEIRGRSMGLGCG